MEGDAICLWICCLVIFLVIVWILWLWIRGEHETKKAAEVTKKKKESMLVYGTSFSNLPGR